MSRTAEQRTEALTAKAVTEQTSMHVTPKDWTAFKIGEVCSLINGRGFKPHEWRDSGLPIIRIQNLNGSEEYNCFSGTYDPKIVVENGQLLFAWSGSRGTSFGPHVWNGSRALLNYHTWKVVPDNAKVDGDYFFHALKHLTDFIEDRAHGASALVHTQKWEMEGLYVGIPPLREQRAIAAALSDVDALIEALEKLIAKKRAIKHAAMQQLLTGKTRLPGFTGRWETKALGEIVDVDPENLPANTDPRFSFNYISLDQVNAGCLDGYAEETFGTAPSRARRVLRVGDVLMSTVRPNLMAHLLYQGQVPNAVCSTGFAVLRSKPWLAAPGFVFSHLFSDVINGQIEKIIAGSNYPAINSRDVKMLAIPCPHTDEQFAIAGVLSDMDAEIAALERRRDKTKAIKQGMMQQLLTGRIRLVKPAVAPAAG